MKIHSILFTRSKQWLKTSLVQCTQLRDFISRTRRISRSAPYYCFKNLSCLPYHSCGNVKLEVSFHKPDGLVKRVELLQQLPYFRQPSVTVYTQKRCQLFQAGNVFQAWFGGGGVGGCHFCRNRHVYFFVLFLYKLLVKNGVVYSYDHSEVFVTQVSLILNETLARLGYSS